MEPPNIARNAPVALPGVATEQDGAGITGASDLSLLQFQKVLVPRPDWSGAQFAHLNALARLAHKSLQGRERSAPEMVGHGTHSCRPRLAAGRAFVDQSAFACRR